MEYQKWLRAKWHKQKFRKSIADIGTDKTACSQREEKAERKEAESRAPPQVHNFSESQWMRFQLKIDNGISCRNRYLREMDINIGHSGRLRACESLRFYCYSGYLVSCSLHDFTAEGTGTAFSVFPFLPCAIVFFILALLLAVKRFGKKEMR